MYTLFNVFLYNDDKIIGHMVIDSECRILTEFTELLLCVRMTCEFGGVRVARLLLAVKIRSVDTFTGNI